MAARAAAAYRIARKKKASKEAANRDGGGWQHETPGGGTEKEEDVEGKDEGGGVADGEASDDELRDWIIGLFKFLCFVSIFTILNVNYRPSVSINEYTTLWKSIIAAEVDDFNFIGDVWSFLKGPLVELQQPDFFSASKSGYWPEDKSQYIYGNRMLGNVRLRQIRVANSECRYMQKLFLEADNSLQKSCFSSYSKNFDEGRSAKFPNYRRARDSKALVELAGCQAQGCEDEDGNITTCCTNWSHFHYKTNKELGESSVDFPAEYNSYPGGGYIMDLVNSTDATEKIKMLQRHGWIDLKTRALFVDFSFYNPNVDLFLVCRICFEFLPSGLVKPFSSYRVVQVQNFLNFSESSTFTQNVLTCVMVALILWLLYDEFEELWHELKGFKYRIIPTITSHLADVWNCLDIATLVLALILLYLQYYQDTVVSEMLLSPNNMDSSKLQNMGFWAQQQQNIAGVQALVLWVKVFKFVAVTAKLKKLFKALARSIPAAIDLLFVYLVLIVAFAVSGVIIFGNDVPLFTTVVNSFWSSIRVALFADYDWDAMYISNRLLGPIWIFLFTLVSQIFLINFLVGIFCEVYAEVMGEEESDKKSILGQAVDKLSDFFYLKRLHAKIADIESKLTDMDADGDGMVICRVFCSVLQCVLLRAIASLNLEIDNLY